MNTRHVILVIDDDLDFRDVLEFVLRDHGYEMAACNNGREALAWLQENTPSVILVDLMMPVMNGRDFLREKAKIPRLEHIPTLVMSASSTLKQEFGSVNVLPKPFDVLLLHMRLEELLTKK